MNVCTKCCPNPSNSYWDIWFWIKAVDRPTLPSIEPYQNPPKLFIKYVKYIHAIDKSLVYLSWRLLLCSSTPKLSGCFWSSRRDLLPGQRPRRISLKCSLISCIFCIVPLTTKCSTHDPCGTYWFSQVHQHPNYPQTHLNWWKPTPSGHREKFCGEVKFPPVT